MNKKNITIENGIVSIPHTGEIWMSEWEIAQLFDCFIAKISANVRSILKSGIFHESDVCRMYHYKNGNSVEQYNLVMITALAFRIKSRNTEIFRKWIMSKAVADTSGISILISKDWSNSKLIDKVLNYLQQWQSIPIRSLPFFIFLFHLNTKKKEGNKTTRP